MDTIILDHLAIGYKGRTLMSNLSLTLHEGCLACLVGTNGVGKSTLLRTLAGFLPKQGGTIRLMGRAVESASPQQLATIVSVVLTDRPHGHAITVSEMVAMGRSPYTGFWGRLSKQDRAVVDEAMQMVGITPLAQRMVSTLSDGERQKVMVAKALAQQTPIILLDEPTAFLDHPSKVSMMQLLHRLAADMGKTIIMSTHDLELAAQNADVFLQMEVNALKIIQNSQFIIRK